MEFPVDNIGVTKRSPRSKWPKCHVCNGTGETDKKLHYATIGETAMKPMYKQVTCLHCGGTGKEPR